MTVTELTKSRKKLGLTQKRLSKLIKKNSTFVCKLENGHRSFRHDLQIQVKKAFAKIRKEK